MDGNVIRAGYPVSSCRTGISSESIQTLSNFYFDEYGIVASLQRKNFRKFQNFFCFQSFSNTFAADFF